MPDIHALGAPHPATLRERLVVYHRNTVELFPYYRAKDLLVEVQGQGDIENIYNQIMQALNL